MRSNVRVFDRSGVLTEGRAAVRGFAYFKNVRMFACSGVRVFIPQIKAFGSSAVRLFNSIQDERRSKVREFECTRGGRAFDGSTVRLKGKS